MRNKQNTDGFKTEKHLLTAGLLSAGLILGLGGCTGGAGGGESTKEDPSNAAVDPSGGEESTSGTSEEKVGVPYLGTYPKQTLDGGVDVIGADYTWENGEMTILPYGSRFLIVETPMFFGEEGEPGGMPEEETGQPDRETFEGSETEDPTAEQERDTMVRIFDIETGDLYGKRFSGKTILPEKTCIFEDGTIGLALNGICSYLWLDPELEEIGSFDLGTWKAENPGYEDLEMYRFELRTDRKGGYFVWNNALYYLDMEDGTLTKPEIGIDVSDGIYLSNLLYDNQVLEIFQYTGRKVTYYEYDICTPDQPVFLERRGIDTSLFTKDRSYVGMYTNAAYDEKLLYSGTYGDAEMTWCNIPADFSWGGGFLAGNGVISFSADQKQTITYLDLKEERICSKELVSYYDEKGYSTFYGEMSCGDWECYVVFRDEQGTKFKIYLVDLDRDTEETGTLTMHHVTLEDHSDEEFIRLTGITDPSLYDVGVLMTQYESMDEYARDISTRHGVEVVFGENVEAFNYLVDEFEVTTLIPDEGTWETLATLDRALANYPEGFFEQLRTDMTPDGVVICLAAGMKGKDDTETVNSADGIATSDLSRHLVYLNAYSFGFEQNVYHEFSHVIDHYIENRKFMVANDLFFTEKKWNARNPEGFTYEENYNAYNGAGEGLGKEHNVYGYQNGEIGLNDIYFIDYYATLYATEDRARIMEYACTFKNEEYMQAPHIQEKLRYMSEYIRHYFDDSTWPEVLYWERCLSPVQNINN